MLMPTFWSSLSPSSLSSAWPRRAEPTATGDDAFLDGGPGRVHRVVDAILAFLHLDSRSHHRRGSPQHRRPASPDAPAASRDRSPKWCPRSARGSGCSEPSMSLLLTGAVNERGLFLGDRTRLAVPSMSRVTVLELDAEILGDHLTLGQDRDDPRASPCDDHRSPVP